MEHTDHKPRAMPASNTSHAFPLWAARRSFCGLEFEIGTTVETDRVTCKTCLEELERIRASAPKLCPTCGETCRPDDRKCDECGHDL